MCRGVKNKMKKFWRKWNNRSFSFDVVDAGAISSNNNNNNNNSSSSNNNNNRISSKKQRHRKRHDDDDDGGGGGGGGYENDKCDGQVCRPLLHPVNGHALARRYKSESQLCARDQAVDDEPPVVK